MRKLAVAALTLMTLAGAVATTTTGAEARGWRGGHHHGGFYRGRGFGIGAGVATGLALGALGGAYYGYGPRYYGDGCVRNRVVGYTAYGRAIVRPVNVCY